MLEQLIVDLEKHHAQGASALVEYNAPTHVAAPPPSTSASSKNLLMQFGGTTSVSDSSVQTQRWQSFEQWDFGASELLRMLESPAGLPQRPNDILNMAAVTAERGAHESLSEAEVEEWALKVARDVSSADD